jgi:hypothetical protein
MIDHGVQTVGRGRLRGRYDVLIPLDGTAYVRVTSRKDRSLSRAEILAGLRRICAEFAEESGRDATPREPGEEG